MTTMDEDDLSFYGKDPGATRFGNFINYYSFHSANERLKHFHTSMFPEFDLNDTNLILDIGCNSGELTIEFKKFLENLYPELKFQVLAIDIDPILIKRAKLNNPDNISFVACDIMTECGKNILQDYLNKYNKHSFDVTFCFSVTMWIHINNGDDKFLEFLKYIKLISKSIVIEPQPWKCYRNAQKRMKRAGANFDLFTSLNIRNDVLSAIEKTVTDTHKKVYESLSSPWNRTIQSYHLLESNL
ncbi:probable RNA methyltransferase CG11342 [Colias croceus]|uniref:probable RNA methyltransferase CG11342 n=1 Tax=Colias crocea TaxID=72248 RepID=UPI001E27AD96|nr:probable RNA methyltransferase CG11342 [Colias croceus]